jgi:hypothetical protein
LDYGVKAALAERIISKYELTQEEEALTKAFVEYGREASAAGTVRRVRHQTSSLLLTWNGPWGLYECAGWQGRSPSVDECVAHLRTSDVALFLWEQLRAFAGHLKEQLRLRKYAVSLELCTRTLATEGQCRMHAHIFMVAPAKLQVHSWNMFRFGGSSPHRSDEGLATRARGRAVSTAHHAGLYYVLAPKVGQLWSHGSAIPYEDFVVNPEWVTVLWQTKKLTDERAVEQYVFCKKDVKRHVDNVRYHQRLEHELAQSLRVTKVTQTLQAKLLRRRFVPAVEEVWLPQQQVLQARQRFLVLDGPTRMGKSIYATSLCGPESTLEVNCASAGIEPDLRDFTPGVHEAILFDEARCCMVLAQKKLFQAPPAPVQMGNSRTNCHGYSVWVHGVKLIVASNSWHLELQEVSDGDRRWLEENSVYVLVTQPLWEA